MRSTTSRLVFAIAVLLATAIPARANVPFVDIASSGPLTHVFVGADLSCQVAFRGDRSYELYPPTVAPGDCGTFLAVGSRVFQPDLRAHDDTAADRVSGTPVTPVSQSPVGGTGTKADPFEVVTTAALPGTALTIEQTDTYVRGDLTYRTDVKITNTGAAISKAILYRAGDCYLQESDVGFSFVRFGKAIGCSRNPDNFPPARVEQWVPITVAGAHYWEGRFSEVWQRIGDRTVFPDLCRCLHAVDNGAGISWTLRLPAGASVTRSHYTTFSKNGVSGTPGSADRTPPDVYLSTGGKPVRRLKCVPSSFKLRVNALDASPLGRVQVRLDSRVILKTTNSLSNVRVKLGSARGARHRFTVDAEDSRGNSGRTVVRFKTC